MQAISRCFLSLLTTIYNVHLVNSGSSYKRNRLFFNQPTTVNETNMYILFAFRLMT